MAQLAGISVRTLHHYDEIGLLHPSRKTEAGYRLYSEADLETLQQILFFRELGFSLKKIKGVMHRPTFDRYEALKVQRNMLLEKRDRLNRMIALIEKTIQHTKGEIPLTNKEKFAGFNFKENRYEQEARKRWGDEAVDHSIEKMENLSDEEQAEMAKTWEKLAHIRHLPPTSLEAQEAIERWFHLLNDNFGNYSLDAFKGLGQMYVADERFTKNIDRFGEGLAQFMCEAMTAFTDQRK